MKPSNSRRRLSFREFCDAVREAVDSFPAPFRKYLENVVVDVQEEPTEDDHAELAERGNEPAGLLLGLFRGVALTDQGYGEHAPNVITIFRRPMEAASRTRRALLRNIRATVLHEFAHHFGFSEEDLEAFERAQDELEDRESESPDDPGIM
jgi:predicted Zn-dependent protease with MMP-like domain